MRISQLRNININENITFKSNIFNEFNIKKYVNSSDCVDLHKKTSDRNENKMSIFNKCLIVAGSLAAAFAGVSTVLNANKTNNLKPTEELKAVYADIINKYPSDKPYYETIAKEIGLKPEEEYKLASIVGPTQLKSLLSQYSPEDFKVGENFEGVKNYTFRVDLHNHTTASDGFLSVNDFLEQARKWADRVKEYGKNNNLPSYTVAITDHDTLEGAKEAVKILSQSPEKYKNLRVVLGSEISVSHLKSEDVIRPVDFELLGYALNPFNEKLNSLLETTKANRTQAIKTLINATNAQYPNYNLSFEEAQKFHSNLRNVRTNGVLYLAKDYAAFKIRLSDYVNQINETIVPENAEKLDVNKIFGSIAKNYYYNMDATSESDMAKFLRDKALKPILESRYLLNDDNLAIYDRIFEKDYSQLDDFLSARVKDGIPTIEDTKNYCLRPEEVFDAIETSDNFGFFGMAHPAKIRLNSYQGDNISEKRKNNLHFGSDTDKDLVYAIFKNLKDNSNGLFCASETNYQSYKNMGKDWIRFMQEDIADNPEFKFLHTGGTDTHSPSIFSNHSYVEDKFITQNNLQEILGEQHASFANLLKSFEN